VLDNSMSSGRIEGRERVLDRLADVALRTLDAAGPEDRIWVLRAGEPWDVAVPGGAREARVRVLDTRVSAAAGNVGSALVRARELVLAAGLPRREVHLLSDLQESGFAGAGIDLVADLPTVVWAPAGSPSPNHRIEGVLVGGGLPPLVNRRTEVTVTLGGSEGGDPLPIRLVIGDRIRAAATARPGESVVLPVGPFQLGPVEGWVETDPDALGADDRRYFAFSVGPAVPVALVGPGGFFLVEGLASLADAGRIRLGSPGEARVVFAAAAQGLDGRAQAHVVVPPVDETLLPGFNRRLSNAGIPWSYGIPPETAEVRIAENRLPLDLKDLRVRRHYALTPAAGTPPDAEFPVGLSDGSPLIVLGLAPSGPYLLLASPLDPEWTTLPVGAAMLPLLEWIVARWAGEGPGAAELSAGAPVTVPATATHVETPAGERHAVDGSRLFRATGEAGLYGLRRGDTLVERVAVNPPAPESRTETVSEQRLAAVLGGRPALAGDLSAWERTIFASRRGPEVWWPLLMAALLLLLLESWVASVGSATDGRSRAPSSLPVESRVPVP
jgi:hypothetical protein